MHYRLLPKARYEALVAKGCPHELAGPRDHRCPTCTRTLRRCCQSVTGDPHDGTCAAERRMLVVLEKDPGVG